MFANELIQIWPMVTTITLGYANNAFFNFILMIAVVNAVHMKAGTVNLLDDSVQAVLNLLRDRSLIT